MLSKTICINFISVFKTLYGIRASLTNVLFQFFFKMATPPTSTPSPPPASPISSMTLLNPPLSTPTVSTSAISFHNSVTHKLTRDNYSLWKTTVVPILKGHSLFGFVDGTSDALHKPLLPPLRMVILSIQILPTLLGLCKIN